MHKYQLLNLLLLLMVAAGPLSAAVSSNHDAKIDELIKLVENPEPFQPLSDEHFEAGKKDLLAALAVLDQQLIAAGPNQEQLWKGYLQWDELIDQIEAEKPSRSALINIARQYQMNHAGLELKIFTDVRSAIIDFANLSYFRSEAVSKRIYDGRLRLIKSTLEQLKEGHDDRMVGRLGAAITDLESSGNCKILVASIRSAFAKPNFHFEVSEKMARSLLKKHRAFDSRPVFEEILGVQQRGTAQTTSSFDVNFLPSHQSGRFKFCIRGDMVSDQVGTKELGLLGNVYICSNGNTCLVGEAVVDFDGRRLSYSNLAAGARTRTHIKGVDTPPLLRGATLKQIEKKKSQGEAEAARKARAKFLREFKSQLVTALGKANHRLKHGVAKTVRRLDFEPKRLEVATSDDAFRVLAIVGTQKHLTTLNGPQAEIAGDVVAQVHESSINNGLQHLLGGRKVSMDELRKLIESFGVELPPPPEDEKPLTITFPRVRPVQVSFDQQKVTTVISANQIESGRTVVKDDLTITIQYSIDSTADSVLVKLADEARIDFEGAYTNSKSIIESVIKPKLDKVVKKETREFSISELEIPEEVKKLGLPQLHRLEFSDGWMVMVLGASDKKKVAGAIRKSMSDSRIVRRIRSGTPVKPLIHGNSPAAFISDESN